MHIKSEELTRDVYYHFALLFWVVCGPVALLNNHTARLYSLYTYTCVSGCVSLLLFVYTGTCDTATLWNDNTAAIRDEKKLLVITHGLAVYIQKKIYSTFRTSNLRCIPTRIYILNTIYYIIMQASSTLLFLVIISYNRYNCHRFLPIELKYYTYMYIVHEYTYRYYV